jgi:benzoate/toluate 1,2-dioxygenase beta subunit
VAEVQQLAKLTRQDAEDFLYHEAALLDQRRFEEWLKLFTEDGIYWIPIEDGTDPLLEASILYDDSLMREQRIYQLLHTPHYAQRPASRTEHLVTNVTVSAGSENNEVLVHCKMACFELREGDHLQLGLGDRRWLAGTCEYRLRYENGSGWAIVLKKVVLIDRDLPVRNLSFIL